MSIRLQPRPARRAQGDAPVDHSGENDLFGRREAHIEDQVGPSGDVITGDVGPSELVAPAGCTPPDGDGIRTESGDSRPEW